MNTSYKILKVIIAELRERNNEIEAGDAQTILDNCDNPNEYEGEL